MTNMTKRFLKPCLTSLLALTFAAACGNPAREAAEVKVTNGVSLKETDFPSTVLLVSLSARGESICTGTFVNDSQVVTAAHCVEGLKTDKPYLFYVTEKGGRTVPVAQAISYARNPGYSFEQGVSPYDIAVINFPANSAPAVSPLAEATPAVGESFTIIGYGNNENFFNTKGVLDGSGAGSKRAGSNRLSQVSGGMLGFAGLKGTQEGATAGQLVAAGSGDSGGPLFVGGKLAGVTSGGGLSKTEDGLEIAISYYVDVNSPLSQSFLKGVLKAE